MENFVSVIIPTFNRTDFLPKAIDSVLAQTYPHYELIVVDDGSEDDTPELVAGYGEQVKYIRQENRGPAAARNRGVAAARYNLLAFLDSDDRFVADKLKIQVRAMQENPTCLVSHTGETWYRNGQIMNQKNKHKKNSGDIFNQSLELCAVGMSTVMMHRELFQHYGLFDEKFPCCEDYELWLRVSAAEKFLLVDQPLTIKDGGRADQLSVRYRVGMDKYRIEAICKILDSGVLSGEQEEAAMDELQRKCIIYGNGCIKHGRIDEGRYYLGLPEMIGNRQTI